MSLFCNFVPPLVAPDFCQSTSNIHSYGSAVAAVLIGAALAFYYSKRLEKRKAQIATLLEFSTDLNAIRTLSEEYWLGDHSDKKEKSKLAVAGYKLCAALMATTEYRSLMISLLGKRFSDFENLDTRLMIVATGGNFQTSMMKASPETYQEISYLVFKTEAILRELRSHF